MFYVWESTSEVPHQLQNKNDPNLTMCPTDHPFISVSALEAEGLKLLEGVITMLYTSRYVISVSVDVIRDYVVIPGTPTFCLQS